MCRSCVCVICFFSSVMLSKGIEPFMGEFVRSCNRHFDVEERLTIDKIIIIISF